MRYPPRPSRAATSAETTTSSRLRGHFHGGDVIHGRHVTSSVVAGLRSSCPHGLVRNHMPMAIPRSYVHGNGSDIDHGRPVALSAVAALDPPSVLQRPRLQRHPTQSSTRPRPQRHPCGCPAPPCPRRHDRGRPVTLSTAVVLAPPPLSTQPHPRRRRSPQPSRGLVRGDGPRPPHTGGLFCNDMPTVIPLMRRASPSPSLNLKA